MKNFTKSIFTIFAAMSFVTVAIAQCPGGQVNLTVDVTTDNWGYECYWELTPQGNACGTGTIVAYGNATVVGCSGAGAQVAASTDPGVYPDNATTTETVGCVTDGTCYTLHYVDDWGDGGATFDIYVDGILVATYVGAGTGGTFDFCANAPQAFDAAITAVTPYEYTKLPIGQLGSPVIAMEATVENVGSSAITNVVINGTVTNPTSVYTGSSTPIATMASAATQTQTLTPATFTPTGMGLHVFEFTASMTETDGNSANDMMSFTVDVNDTVMARDDSTFAGTLGIGAGPGLDGRLGQIFHASANGSITSASAQFGNGTVGPMVGDFTTFYVYEMTGGVPAALLASSADYTFTLADSTNGVFVTMPFSTPVPVTAGSDYLVAVGENNANVSVATNVYAVTPGTNWVNWTGAPTGDWDLAENFGSQFAVQYVLRANFNDESGLVENILNDNVGVYPNPSNGSFSVQISNVVANEVMISVKNVEGKTIANEVVYNVNGNTQVPFQFDNLDAGVYLIEVTSNNSSVVERIVITE